MKLICFLLSDVSDYNSVKNAHDTICSTLPPLAGVIQGAMVLHDTPIRDMNLDHINTVFGPKVEGSKNLDRVLGSTPLDFLLFLSSMATVLSNMGQANYSAANAYMTGLAAQRRRRGLAASVVYIGAVTGAGYVQREAGESGDKNLLITGLRRISEVDVHQMLAESIELGRANRPLSPEEDPEIGIGMRAVSPSDQWLPSWFDNPKFGRFILSEKDADADRGAGQKDGVSIKERLALAQSKDQVYEIIRGKNILEKTR